MRFRLFSILVGVAAAAVLCGLNARTTESLTEPEYGPMWGVAPHPPPYALNEMFVTVHSDRGWPLWHTRASDHFAAHNAGAYLNDGGLPYERATPETDYVRAGVDLGVGLLILAMAVFVSDSILRMFHPGSTTGRPSPDAPQRAD